MIYSRCVWHTKRYKNERHGYCGLLSKRLLVPELYCSKSERGSRSIEDVDVGFLAYVGPGNYYK